MRGEFTVVQFFPDGTYEKVREFVDANESVAAAVNYCASIGARIGTTRRVIITDGGDCIVYEWVHGKGVVFPPANPAPVAAENAQVRP
jgi:hypothetical protein